MSASPCQNPRTWLPDEFGCHRYVRRNLAGTGTTRSLTLGWISCARELASVPVVIALSR
jgi:hypothetical protein